MTLEEAKAIRACNGRGYSTIEFIKALQLTEPNPSKNCSREGKEMITEDYVSFETAKLLKEKGFDEPAYRGVSINNLIFVKEEPEDFNHKLSAYCSQPTLQMAMKWLRENHNMFIRIIQSHIDYCTYEVYYDRAKHYESRESYNTYEEACEAAIKYCLENLI